MKAIMRPVSLPKRIRFCSRRFTTPSKQCSPRRSLEPATSQWGARKWRQAEAKFFKSCQLGGSKRRLARDNQNCDGSGDDHSCQGRKFFFDEVLNSKVSAPVNRPSSCSTNQHEGESDDSRTL